MNIMKNVKEVIVMSRLVKIVDNKYVQIEEYRNPNICFNTSEYDDFEDYCTLRETFDPFEMFYENQELKKKYENAVVDYEITTVEKNELKNQQKKFMLWLEDESKEIYRDGGLRQNIFKQALQKYKEITGILDGKEN